MVFLFKHLPHYFNLIKDFAAHFLPLLLHTFLHLVNDLQKQSLTFDNRAQNIPHFLIDSEAYCYSLRKLSMPLFTISTKICIATQLPFSILTGKLALSDKQQDSHIINTKHLLSQGYSNILVVRINLYFPAQWQTQHFIFLILCMSIQGEEMNSYRILKGWLIFRQDQYYSNSRALTYSQRSSWALASPKLRSIILYNSNYSNINAQLGHCWKIDIYRSDHFSLLIQHSSTPLTNMDQAQQEPTLQMEHSFQEGLNGETTGNAIISVVDEQYSKEQMKGQTIQNFINAFTKRQKSVEQAIELDDDDCQIEILESKPDSRRDQLQLNLDITIEDEDLQQLEQYKIQTPQPEVFLAIIDMISRLAPQYPFQRTLCLIDNYYQHNDKKNDTTTLLNDVPPSNNNINNPSNLIHLNNPHLLAPIIPNNPIHFENIPIPTSINQLPNAYSLQSNNFVKRHRIRRHFSNNLGFSDPRMTMSYREELQRKIAYIFILKGYGLGITRQALKQDIQNNLYNSLLTSIIRSALRKLIDILNNNLKLNVEPFESRDEINLRSPMANCRKWMDSKDQATLYKIISILYSLNVQQIYPQQVASLYFRICKYIDKRTPNSIHSLINIDPTIQQPNPNGPIQNISVIQKVNNEMMRPQFDRQSMNSNLPPRPMFVTPQYPYGEQKNDREYQKQMLHLFMKYGNIERITQILAIKHPKRNTTKQIIYQVIEKVIKLGLKRLTNSYLHFKNTKQPILPPFVINQYIVAYMMRDKSNSKFRMTLLKLMNQCSSSMTEEKLTNIVNFINQYIDQHQLPRIKPESGLQNIRYAF